MKNGILKLSWGNVRSAIVYGVLMGLLALISYISKLEVSSEVLAILAVVTSVIKNLLTTNSGNFLGLVDTNA